MDTKDEKSYEEQVNNDESENSDIDVEEYYDENARKRSG